MSRRASILGAAAILALAGLDAAASPQQLPVLTGRVTETTGLPVAAVIVTRLNLATRGADVRATDSDGRFVFESTEPGTYRLTFEKSGFQPVVLDRIVVAGGARGSRQVDVVLEPGRLSELVTVTAAAPVPSTGAKLALPVRDLPVTVGAVGSQTLKEQASETLGAAMRNISGATAFVRYGAYQSFTVRGFNTEGGTAHIMLLSDGVRNEGGRIASLLTNVDRIEVLKGPASVLYGGQGLAGAINLIRKQPSARPAYDLSISAGTFHRYRSTFGATGAVAGNAVLYRLDAGFEHADNWRHAGSRRVNVTPSLHWAPTPEDRITLHLSVDRDDFDSDAGIPLLDGRHVPDIPLSRRFNTPQDFVHSRDRNLQARYVRRLSGSVQIRNVFSYRWYDIDYLSAESMTAVSPGVVARRFLYFGDHLKPGLNQTEVQAQFRVLGMDNRLLGGWELQRVDNVVDRSATASTPATPIDLFDPVETHVSRAIELTGFDRFRHTVNAFYFQNHLALADNVKLLVGGRGDVFRRSAQNDSIVEGAIVSGAETQRAIEAFSPRTGVVYQPSSRMSIYGSYGSSFTPVNTIPHDGRMLDPERGRQAEVGYRLDLSDQLNLTVAYYNLVRSRVPVTIGPTATGPVIEQAGKQRSRGVEVDLVGQFSERLHATANYGFTDSRYLDFQSGGVDLSGRRTAFAPRHTANLWSTYTFGNGLGVGLGGRFVGTRFSNFFNTVAIDSYTTWDAAAFYRRSNWELALNLNNLFDEEHYFVGVLYNTQLYPGPPFNTLLTMRLRLEK